MTCVRLTYAPGSRSEEAGGSESAEEVGGRKQSSEPERSEDTALLARQRGDLQPAEGPPPSEAHLKLLPSATVRSHTHTLLSHRPCGGSVWQQPEANTQPGLLPYL